ncbi:MAG TPA: molybdate ABC transporter permease subunit, partial [Paracoccaceae bacterium]|nr:molybdate ABC transporter permease subunit [Paracoccaceae bacterium]
MTRIDRRRRVLPGFGLSLGVALTYVAIIIILPLIAMGIQTTSLGWDAFWRIITSDRAVATYRVTLSAAGLATLFNAGFGL